jgi:hypothetical protein
MLLLLAFGCSDYDVTRVVNMDAFQQGDGEVPADILWVVDDSASMREEQETVLAYVDRFVDALALSGLDYRIGVTTTDTSEAAGRLVGDVLSPETPAIATALLDQMAVGTYGDRTEAPLEAARAVVAGDDAASNALRREDARFDVIVLSDEDDHSTEPVTAYLAAIEEREGADGYRVSAIAGGLPEGCASPVAQAEGAPRLYDAAVATGGIFGSICETDFADILTSLGLRAAGMEDHFYLADIPEVSSLEVRVDDVSIHQRPTDGWNYDPGENAIVFDGYAIPRPGQTIEVRYYDYLGTDASEE